MASGTGATSTRAWVHHFMIGMLVHCLTDDAHMSQAVKSPRGVLEASLQEGLLPGDDRWHGVCGSCLS